ncbi:MAG: ice-binding family protein [Desulfobulbaceae bacterium]|nr:ice-binding family protein [Desulfobulbaceae bacterium]
MEKEKYMKTMNTQSLPVMTRAKWIIQGLVLTAALFVPYQDATADQTLVNLGSADSFAVLAATTITSTSGGTINGDVGVWPGAAFVVGVPPVKVNGTLHLGDPIAAQAQGDLTTAYNDAAARTLDVIVVSDGELGGKTLAPGLYKSAPGSFAMTSADLTLDARGDPNAVWIFQMASTLIVGNGRQVILAGGAQANNIFWQVGSSATLGTTSVFKGNILAYTAITVMTGAVLTGRALARNAAVTLDSNTISVTPTDAMGPDQPWRILLMN